MAHLCNGGQLVREKWREQNSAIKAAVGPGQIKAEHKVPENDSDLYAWARLDKNPNQLGRSRSQALLLVDPSSPYLRRQVAIKVHGFAKPGRICLSTLGTWNGKIGTAMAARQTLVLTDGGYPEPFARQYEALSKLVHYCRQQSPMKSWSTLRPHWLEFERPVFTRVNRKDPRLALTRVEDPFGLAERISDQWAVKDKLLIGVKGQAEDKIQLANANSIKAGDFLEVTFVFDMSRQGTRDPKFNIRMWMTHVVQLCPKAKLPKIQQRETTAAVVMTTMGDDSEWGLLQKAK